MGLVDWKRNNKISLRNFSESCDLHDIVKTQLVRMLRRNYPDSNKYPIYTEFHAEKPNESYPDIWMKIKNDVYVWEIQKEMTKSWTKQIQEKYEDVNLIIVDLKEVNDNIDTLYSSLDAFLERLKKELKKYII